MDRRTVCQLGAGLAAINIPGMATLLAALPAKSDGEGQRDAIHWCLSAGCVRVLKDDNPSIIMERVYGFLMAYAADQLGAAVIVPSRSGSTLMSHLIAGGAKIDFDALLAGRLGVDEQQEFVETIRSLASRPGNLTFVDTQTGSRLMEDLSQIYRAGNLQLVIIPVEAEAHADIANEVAKTFNIPVVVVCAPGILGETVCA